MTHSGWKDTESSCLLLKVVRILHGPAYVLRATGRWFLLFWKHLCIHDFMLRWAWLSWWGKERSIQTNSLHNFLIRHRITVRGHQLGFYSSKKKFRRCRIFFLNKKNKKSESFKTIETTIVWFNFYYIWLSLGEAFSTKLSVFGRTPTLLGVGGPLSGQTWRPAQFRTRKGGVWPNS